MPNILITTFGATWQIVPELLGFANPELVDLYANHPKLEAIDGSRQAAFRRPLRQKMLREAEAEIIALIQEGLPS